MSKALSWLNFIWDFFKFGAKFYKLAGFPSKLIPSYADILDLLKWAKKRDWARITKLVGFTTYAGSELVRFDCSNN